MGHISRIKLLTITTILIKAMVPCSGMQVEILEIKDVADCSLEKTRCLYFSKIQRKIARGAEYLHPTLTIAEYFPIESKRVVLFLIFPCSSFHE